MKKRVMFWIILVMLLIPVAHATIEINTEPESNYNLGDKIITHADEPGRIQAYKKLRRQQLRLVSFEGRPYAIETVQEVWGETDGESNFMIRIYTPEGDNPLKLAEELRRVVEDTIKLKHE